MGFIKQRLERALFGDSDIRVAGQIRAMRGFRERDRTELYLGMALIALAWLRKPGAGRELIERRYVPRGTAMVVHNRRRRGPRLEFIEPARLPNPGSQTR